jgi:hypothetical protein
MPFIMICSETRRGAVDTATVGYEMDICDATYNLKYLNLDTTKKYEICISTSELMVASGTANATLQLIQNFMIVESNIVDNMDYLSLRRDQFPNVNDYTNEVDYKNAHILGFLNYANDTNKSFVATTQHRTSDSTTSIWRDMNTHNFADVKIRILDVFGDLVTRVSITDPLARFIFYVLILEYREKK